MHAPHGHPPARAGMPGRHAAMTRAAGHAAGHPSMGWLRSLAAGLGRWRERRAKAAPGDAPDGVAQGQETAWQPTIQASEGDARDAASEARPGALTAKVRAQYVVKADQAATQNTPYSENSRSTPFHWGPHTWQQIEWRRQLVVVAGLFRQVGFQPRSLRAVGLTGADVLLTSGSGQLLLRCVATRAGVSLSDMQAFARSMQARGQAHATYATSGRISDKARAYARERHIHTLDGEQLLALIATRTPEQQDSLLQAAYAGAYWRPSCIRCGVKLAPKLRAGDHRPQWVCQNAPRCTVTLPMDMAQLSARERPARRTAPSERAGFVDPAYAATEPLPL